MRSVFWLFLLALTVIPCGAVEPTDYYNHVVFDNSITPDYYYYSSGRSVFPSTIQLLSGALPVEHKNFFDGAECPASAMALRARGKLGSRSARSQYAQSPDRLSRGHALRLVFF